MVRPVKGLVLGGGGITGIAWETGVIAGLAERGLQVASADLVVGTSAGSVVGAQLLSGTPVAELYARQLAGTSESTRGRIGLGLLARWVLAAGWPGDEVRARSRLGRAALKAPAMPEAEWRTAFESLLQGAGWPDRRLLITAVEAESGQERVFDRESGIPLLDAVAASCAVPMIWPPVTIDGRRYIDGGVRSATNADLATGCDRVVVLAPITFALRRRRRVSAQLRSLGEHVQAVVITPDRAARRAIGRNVLDPDRRAESARAGLEQGRAMVSAVRSTWEESVAC